MTTYEWLGLIVVLIGGFWKLSNKLTKIEVALSGKVGFEYCSERQDKCPCHKRVEEMEKLMEKLHPHQK
jgi:hypothetical protein